MTAEDRDTIEQAEREAAVMRIQNAAAYIPRELLSEEQAERNHGQTLAKLHQRGGLSAQEAAALILCEKWTAVNRTTEEAWGVIIDAARAAGRGEAAEHETALRRIEVDLMMVMSCLHENATDPEAWAEAALAGVRALLSEGAQPPEANDD